MKSKILKKGQGQFNISVSTDSHEFIFISRGKGDLEKLVQYRPFENDKDIYNLALGTIKDDGSVDYEPYQRMEIEQEEVSSLV